MNPALETIPGQMWKRLNKLDLAELDVPKWSITVNETGVQVSFLCYIFLDIIFCTDKAIRMMKTKRFGLICLA